jgi:histone acetyltransferase (RNA polymerase elongator complex component)
VYCNQTVITGITDTEIINSATVQLKKWRERSESWDELAFYGGTFTKLPLKTREALYKLAAGIPIRISTCPDDLPPDFIDEINNFNIKTVEFGVQSLSDSVLKLNGRTYTAAQAVDTINSIANSVDISLQFMVGMYGETRGELTYTANNIPLSHPSGTLPPGGGDTTNMARIYPTLVLKDTTLERLYREGRYQPLTPAETLLRATWLYLALELSGYKVIRMGLPPEAQGDSVVAGYWHPSFGDIVRKFALQRTSGIDTIEQLRERYNEGDLWFTEKSNIDLANELTGASNLR